MGAPFAASILTSWYERGAMWNSAAPPAGLITAVICMPGAGVNGVPDGSIHDIDIASIVSTARFHGETDSKRSV